VSCVTPVCCPPPHPPCRYLYYFENGCPIIHVRYISGLIALINEQNAAADPGTPALSSAVEAHYHNTLGTSLWLMRG
jgi:hypothetical protein